MAVKQIIKKKTIGVAWNWKLNSEQRRKIFSRLIIEFHINRIPNRVRLRRSNEFITMPANSIDFYLQDARTNFNSVRPAPIYTDANQVTGPCQNIHISMNCYYGYHGPKNIRKQNVSNDCEMLELPAADAKITGQTTSRKRSAENTDFLQTKRLRGEVQRNKTIEPETSETTKLDTSAEHLESLYWNIHGGNLYHLKQC